MTKCRIVERGVMFLCVCVGVGVCFFRLHPALKPPSRMGDDVIFVPKAPYMIHYYLIWTVITIDVFFVPKARPIHVDPYTSPSI